MLKRRPADDRRISCHPTATDRCPGGHHWGACRSSSGHRPKILSSAEQIGQWPNSLPTAAGRRLLPDFYDMVQGRENPAMICRCQKVGIGEKSGSHRRIYKACDVPLSLKMTLIVFCHSFFNTGDLMLKPKVDIPLFVTNANPLQLQPSRRVKSWPLGRLVLS